MRADQHRTVQATIAVDQKNSASFENFHANENRQTVAQLMQMVASGARAETCYLWGARGSGKSHLLFAACNNIPASVYVPVMDLEVDPQNLKELETYRLICLDDVHTIASQVIWEDQILALLNNAEANGNTLLVTGKCPPGELNFSRKDLVNRLSGRQVLKLVCASDETKARILIESAKLRGLIIEEFVVRFIFRRHSRDMHSLVRLLDRIALASLEERRRITIPFLQELDEFKD